MADERLNKMLRALNDIAEQVYEAQCSTDPYQRELECKRIAAGLHRAAEFLAPTVCSCREKEKD